MAQGWNRKTGPYEFRIFTPSETEAPRLQKEEDLRGDDLKHYKAEIEAINLILISIPNYIYNSVYACTTAKPLWKRVERLMRGTVQNQVDRETRFNNEFDQFVTKPGEALVSLKYVTQIRLAKRLTEDSYYVLFDYLQQFEKLVNASRAKKLEKSHDPLALVAHTGSSSRTSSPYYVTHPSSVVDYDDDYQGDTNDAGNIQRTLRTAFSGTVANDEAGVILTDEQNDFLFADASRMEVIDELSANICLMASFQPANIDSDAGPSYDYAFLSMVQTPSTGYVNPLFAKDYQEQKHLTQPKIINKSTGDDQIDSNIIFDEPNEDVNSGSVENDNNVQDSYELEQLVRNAYKEAEKQQIIAKQVQQQNIMLTKQLEFSLIPLSRGSFDVIVGMDWLSKRKFVIVFHEKVVRIPLEGEEILRVHGERTQGVVKTLMNTKLPRACPFLKIDFQSSYHQLRVHEDAIPKTAFRMRYRHFESTVMPFGLTNALASKEGHEVHVKLVLGSLGKEKLYAKFSKFLTDVAESVRDVIGFEYFLASSQSMGHKAECIDSDLLERTMRSRVIDFGGMLSIEHWVSPWKGVVHFGKKGKLAPRYVGPIEILERIGLVAYRLRLLEELNSVHDTFHVSNLKKCLADANLHVPLNEIKIDKTLRFVEEPIEIMDCEVNSLKRSRIPLVKVRWNLKCGPEFTWECEDYMRSKYP
ncbi:integrase, catalytic region, zinc finger, CCHC-type containing protein [Tanacetum coccineum]